MPKTFDASRPPTAWPYFLKPSEIAEIARIRKRRVLAAIRAGELKVRRRGQTFLASKTDVLAWLDRDGGAR